MIGVRKRIIAFLDESGRAPAYTVMDHASGETWADFEDALSRINFNDKIPIRIHNEDETEDEDNIAAGKYLRYIYPLIILFIRAAKLWGEFFRLWLKSIEHKIENFQFYISHFALCAIAFLSQKEKTPLTSVEFF